MQKEGTPHHQAPSACLAEKAGGLESLAISCDPSVARVTHGNPTDTSACHSDQLPCQCHSFPRSADAFVVTAVLETSLSGLLPFEEGNPGFNLSPKPPLRPQGSAGKGWFVCWWLAAKPKLPSALPSLLLS